jgi:hypothetical protein
MTRDPNRHSVDASSIRVALAVIVFALVELTAGPSGTYISGQIREPSTPRAIAERLADIGESVCDAILLPEKAGHPPTVVASFDNSGRGFCNTVRRIRADPIPRDIQSFQVWMVPHVGTVVTDLNGDGVWELVLPRAISSYEGAQACVAAVPVVYTCRLDTCEEEVAPYHAFYAETLARLADAIVNARARGENVLRGEACRMLESAKVRRMLGEEPRAGSEQAETWMKSPESILRRMAVTIFADVDDPTARERLEILVADDDPTVANSARGALERLQ